MISRTVQQISVFVGTMRLLFLDLGKPEA